ncbi:MAG: fluoride efflux transporter CrcB [Sphingomonadales bacterium]
MPTIMLVALGGGLGAACRFIVSGQVARLVGNAFPYGTLAVNLLGGFLMGALVAWLALRVDGGAGLRAFLGVGVLGGFTTFSAFSMEVMLLIERQAWLAAAAYMSVSVIASVLALAMGAALVRGLA